MLESLGRKTSVPPAAGAKLLVILYCGVFVRRKLTVTLKHQYIAEGYERGGTYRSEQDYDGQWQPVITQPCHACRGGWGWLHEKKLFVYISKNICTNFKLNAIISTKVIQMFVGVERNSNFSSASCTTMTRKPTRWRRAPMTWESSK